MPSYRVPVPRFSQRRLLPGLFLAAPLLAAPLLAAPLLAAPLLAAPLLAASLPAGDPVPFSEESVAAGAELFQRYCTECHGRDGRAEMDVISDATNLTEPDEYYNGASREAMYRSIHEGAGVGMPPFSFQLQEQADIWHLVNFIRSLWTAQQRDAH